MPTVKSCSAHSPGWELWSMPPQRTCVIIPAMQIPAGRVFPVIAALIYMSLATGFVRADRQVHSGGFINLQGMMSGLVTLPVAFLLEYYGSKLDFRNNWAMGAAIFFCGALVFGLSFGTLVFADLIWNWTPAPR